MRQAFISVSQKENVLALARTFLNYDIRLIASDGTAHFLNERGIEALAMSEYLKLEPILNGRVKTLHPLLYGAILADRNDAAHCHDLKTLQISPIDFVIVDLYPFSQNKEDEKEAIEHIDIGGVSLIRASAKNYQYSTVIANEKDYLSLIEELNQEKGQTRLSFRKRMAKEAFKKTMLYDREIMEWLSGEAQSFSDWNEALPLSYGENPHQKAGFYTRNLENPAFSLLQGKPLSYNNLLDLDAGIRLVNELPKTSATVIKHTNPCGVAIADTSDEAVSKAWFADEKSAFGGIVVLNDVLDEKTALFLSQYFLEMVAAPEVHPDALRVFKKKSKLRVIEYEKNNLKQKVQIKTALNGILMQESDGHIFEMNDDIFRETPPFSEDMKNDLLFAAFVAKHVKSNAIVIAHQGVSVAIGAGQTSRIDAVEIACKKFEEKGGAENAVLASDGFFPFSDSIERIASAGIKAIIQPGGSIRDAEVISASERSKIVMVITGTRNFKH